MTQNLYESLGGSDEIISLILRGEPGSGKTWKAAHFPNPVFFNFDRNLSCLRKLPDEIKSHVRVVDPYLDANGKKVAGEKVWDNFYVKLARVVEEPGLATIVFDSLTTMGDCLLDKVVGTSSPAKQPEIQHYGAFVRWMKGLGEQVIQASDRDKIFIFTAHEEVSGEGVNARLILSMPTKMKESFPLYFTDMWRCDVRLRGAKQEYIVRTVPGAQFKCKCSLTVPNEFVWDDEWKSIVAQVNPA